MKRIFAIVMSACAAVAVSQASPPSLINYQGRLIDTGGDPVNGAVSVVVRVFTQASGGTDIWEQDVGSVDVTDGMYALQFGDAGLLGSFTNSDTWVELTVDGETLDPRVRLSSVPYALRAAVASQLEVPLAGMPSGGIAVWSGTLENIPEGWILCDGENDTPDLRERFVMGAADAEEPGGTGGANSYSLSVAQLPVHTHTASANTTGAHTHSGSTASSGNHSDHSMSTGSGGNHGHTVTADNSLGSSTARPGGGVGGSRTTQGENGVNGASHNHNITTLSSSGAHTHTVTVNSGGGHTHTITVNNTGNGEAIDNRPAFYALAFIMKL